MRSCDAPRRMNKRVIPPLKTGATLPQPDWPGDRDRAPHPAAMARLDVTANTMMLGDPAHRALHHRGPQACDDRWPAGATPRSWRDIGRCMASACSWSRRSQAARSSDASARGIRRAGRGLRSAGVSQREFRGKGYAVEAARASIDWSFATFESDEIIHCIDRENTASQAVARRLGAHPEGETMLTRAMPLNYG